MATRLKGNHGSCHIHMDSYSNFRITVKKEIGHLSGPLWWHVHYFTHQLEGSVFDKILPWPILGQSKEDITSHPFHAGRSFLRPVHIADTCFWTQVMQLMMGTLVHDSIISGDQALGCRQWGRLSAHSWFLFLLGVYFSPPNGSIVMSAGIYPAFYELRK